MHLRSFLGAAGLMLAVVGCADRGDPIAASVALGDPVTMAPGDTLPIGGVARLRFDAVVDDSRCALDVVCISAGDAVVRVSLEFSNLPIMSPIMSPIVLLELHAGPGGPASARAYGYRVTLKRLDPQPRAGMIIPQRDNRAVIQVQTDPNIAVPGPGH